MMAARTKKATKTQVKATKAAKKGKAKKVTRVFNNGNDDVDAFRSRLGTGAAKINAVFIKKPKKVFTIAEIMKITKEKKARVRVHLYWASKTFNHIVRVEGGWRKK